jgi:cytidine deaminase
MNLFSLRILVSKHKRFNHGQKFNSFSLLFADSVIQKTINKAKAVRERAYCPYSKFSVGAALLCADGITIIDGCNVENVSYGLTICAERSAIVRAVSQGEKEFKCVAICAEMKDEFVGPCGACRQVLAEFGLNMGKKTETKQNDATEIMILFD